MQQADVLEEHDYMLFCKLMTAILMHAGATSVQRDLVRRKGCEYILVTACHSRIDGCHYRAYWG